MIIATLKEVRLAHKDMYLTYIDFHNAFGFIDHARLLALVEDLRFPQEAVELVGNIYANSTTSFSSNPFSTTRLIQICRGTIHETLEPYLFIVFLEPPIQWLEEYDLGYHFNTSSTTCTSTTYARGVHSIVKLYITCDKNKNKNKIYIL